MNIPILLLVNATSPELFDAALSSDGVSVIQKPCLDRTLIDRVLSLRAAAISEAGKVGRVGEHQR